MDLGINSTVNTIFKWRTVPRRSCCYNIKCCQSPHSSEVSKKLAVTRLLSNMENPRRRNPNLWKSVETGDLTHLKSARWWADAANPVTRVSKGVCLFDSSDINLAQKAPQSKPPLMHCADWAYNIIPAVTAMDAATESKYQKRPFLIWII